MLTLTQHSGNSMFNQRTVMSLSTIRLLRLLEMLRYLAPDVIITSLGPAEGCESVDIQLADGALTTL